MLRRAPATSPPWTLWHAIDYTTTSTQVTALLLCFLPSTTPLCRIPQTWLYVFSAGGPPPRTHPAAHHQLTPLQFGRLTHYAFDAVLSTHSPVPTLLLLPTNRRSLRLPRRRPTLHRPHVRLPPLTDRTPRFRSRSQRTITSENTKLTLTLPLIVPV